MQTRTEGNRIYRQPNKLKAVDRDRNTSTKMKTVLHTVSNNKCTEQSQAEQKLFHPNICSTPTKAQIDKTELRKKTVKFRLTDTDGQQHQHSGA